MTVFTAIIGNYEELKEPAIITPGWSYICFTDQNITSSTWQIKKVQPIFSPIRTAREIKILFHRYIQDKYSLWIDGSFQINCNLNDWWQRFKSPFTVLKHPIRRGVYDDAKYCITFNRGNKHEIQKQVAKYKLLKIPNSYLIQSGILMRERTPDVIDFCEAWYKELMQESTRDQLAFAYAAHQMPIYYLTDWNYRTSNEFVFSKHFMERK